MGFLQNDCTFFPFTEKMLKQSRLFSCGDKDLDDFFQNDATKYERQLLGKTYCFRLDNDISTIVCAFTLSNSSIDARKLPNNRRRRLTEKIPYEKNLCSYPATLIGRLGVDKEFSGKGAGTELIKYIKHRILLSSYLTACRYLTVDAYNNEPTLNSTQQMVLRPFFRLINKRKNTQDYHKKKN